MTITNAVLMVLGVAAGALVVVAGGMDDSPGLQMVGVVVVAGTLFLGVRAARRPPW